jgi:hypothetical protein
MIRTKYRSTTPLKPKLGPVLRYVRKAFKADGYEWCEKQQHSWTDLAQGTCDADDVPASIRAQADPLSGYAFAYVDWPQT